jgi:hypothetical protein
MKLKVIKAPAGMPVKCWAIVSSKEATISGFTSPEAAHAWATEWCIGKKAIIAPVIEHGLATLSLAAYERHKQGLEEGEEWKRGLQE